MTRVIAGFLELVFLGEGWPAQETDRCRVNYIVIVLITLTKMTTGSAFLLSTSERVPRELFPSIL